MQASASPYHASALHPLWGISKKESSKQLAMHVKQVHQEEVMVLSRRESRQEQNAIPPPFVLVCFHSKGAFRKRVKVKCHFHV